MAMHFLCVSSCSFVVHRVMWAENPATVAAAHPGSAWTTLAVALLTLAPHRHTDEDHHMSETPHGHLCL